MTHRSTVGSDNLLNQQVSEGESVIEISDDEAPSSDPQSRPSTLRAMTRRSAVRNADNCLNQQIIDIIDLEASTATTAAATGSHASCGEELASVSNRSDPQSRPSTSSAMTLPSAVRNADNCLIQQVSEDECIIEISDDEAPSSDPTPNDLKNVLIPITEEMKNYAINPQVALLSFRCITIIHNCISKMNVFFGAEIGLIHTKTTIANSLTQQLKIELAGLEIKYEDLITLTNDRWLNDNVINGYMNLIMKRSLENKDSYSSVYCFSTFFYPNLRSRGYEFVRRWTKKVDLFSFKRILVPIHVQTNHWGLAQIILDKREMNYLDSLGKQDDGCLRILLQYILEESNQKYKKQLDIKTWTLNILKEIPLQNNQNDCGVFVCTFAEHLSRDAPLLFTQENIPYFRTKILYEIIMKKLLN